MEHKKISELIPYVNNARTHSHDQIQRIAGSILEFGFTAPVLIDDRGMILAGHGRVQAAKLAGLEEVPTVTLEGLSEYQKKAYVISDNQLAIEGSDWDMDLLKLEIGNLQENDFDTDLLGFVDLSFLDDPEMELDNNDYDKEIDVDNFEDQMELKFKLSFDQYEAVNSKLLQINSNKEIALLTLVGVNA